MHQLPLTYETLLQNLQQQLQLDQINKQTAANRASALRLFLRTNHLTEQDVVGLEMRSEFSLATQKLSEQLQAEDRPGRTITNILSMLRRFREMVVAEDKMRAAAADAASPFLQALRSLMEGQAVKRVAKQADISHDMMFGWLKGKEPRASNAKFIHRLESFFGIERGSLAVLAGIHGDKRPSPTVGVAPPSEYRERLKQIKGERLLLTAPPDSPLRRQWAHLIGYKIAAIPLLKRSAKGRWTVAPLQVHRETETSWYRYLGGLEVPSAHPNWSLIASYLGWMALPSDAGGLAMPQEELQTLAWLAVPEFVERYVEWRKKRTGGIVSKATATFFGILAWMTHPEKGYLTQQPHLQKTLPARYQDIEWREFCGQQFHHCAQLKEVYSAEIRPSRDPFQAIRPILDLPQPMDAIVDMIQRMRADRPTGGAACREATWSRNLLLIKLLVSNPLRMRNLASLRWTSKNRDGAHPQNECSLYQRSDKSWWIFVPKPLLKNRRGLVVQDYDAPVHENVWPDLERYLFRHRAALMSSPTDLVLLTDKTDKGERHKEFSTMSHTVKRLTKRYLWKCPGIGTHAFRHLVASAILKSPQGSTKTAALVLNDKESTIEAHYAGLRSGDGAMRMGELLADSFRRM